MLRMPAWSRSPELLRAVTPGTPPEPHVDNQLHDSWAMGCLVYEALTDLHLSCRYPEASKFTISSRSVCLDSADISDQTTCGGI